MLDAARLVGVGKALLSWEKNLRRLKVMPDMKSSSSLLHKSMRVLMVNVHAIAVRDAMARCIVRRVRPVRYLQYSWHSFFTIERTLDRNQL